MTDTQGDPLSPLKRAILELREMRAKLAQVEQARTEPIAIIGQACRFPGGADTPEAFWSLLRDGVDAISEVPRDRWDVDAYYDADPDVPGKIYTRNGGFLGPIDGFDPHFFNISPREAISLDPQQRLLLELSWEALERAGRAPERLIGSRTGVFVGISTCDYGFLQLQYGSASSIDAYFGTGSAASAAAGRLSYVLGLQGPCVAIDTACSSSLVAVHLACQSLRSGECRTALAGGVNLMLKPELTISFCRAHMLAADGRCKTFDAAADGYVRGEGCGVVVLKRLSDAIAEGDQILAVIRGSAVNQDGRSGGLTVPNGLAQEALIREALAAAGVAPSEVGYLEAHGTGTSLGDPIEVRALGAVLREGRSADQPLILGSVKTNVGHLEAAAGVAGLIKVVLSMQHGQIPSHLHFKQVNPAIALADIPAVVPTALMPWPEGRPRIAGLSSFGFTGTNAHLVVEQAPAAEAREPFADRPLHVLTLSAKSEAALLALGSRFAQHLGSDPSLSLADAAFTANMGRGRFAERLAVVAGTAGEAAAILTALAAGEEPAAVSRGRFQGADRPEVAFLFTGQGSQYAGMGRQLYETEATFREAVDRCDEILAPLLPKRLLAVLYGEDTALLDETAYTQPALFAIEYALSELWRSWGIEPSAVMGHSVGEYVAACVAGVFSLEDALRLVAARGRLMGSLPSGGGMAAILATEARVRQGIARHGSALSIAAVNGPESVVISGEMGALEAAVAEFTREGVRTKRLVVSHAFHSALMEPVLAEFERVAGEVKYAAPAKTFVSNVTGRVMGAEECGAGYWRRHAREAVRFGDGMKALWDQGYRVFVEVGPSPTLLGMGRQCVSESEAAWIPSLRKDREDWREMLGSAGLLFTRGVELDWARFDHGYPRRKMALPTYPFERQRYWAEAAVSRLRPSARGTVGTHPLLGRRLRSPLITGVVFEVELGIAALPLLGEHRILGTVVVPAATYVEMALAAAREAWGGDGWALEDLGIAEAMVLPEEGTRAVQILLTASDVAAPTFEIASAGEGTDGAEPTWTRHATGTLRAALPEVARTPPDALPLTDLKARCPQAVAASAYYGGLRERGFELGPGFQAIAGLWCGDRESLAELRLPPGAADVSSYQIHPSLFDACCHALGAAFPATDSRDESYLVLGFQRLEIFAPIGTHVWSHGALQAAADGKADNETLTGTVRLMDDAGRLVAVVDGLQFKRARAEALGRVARESLGDWLYEVAWPPRAGHGEASARSAAESLLTPDEIGTRVRPEYAGLAETHGLAQYESWLPQIEALAGAYVVRAFQQLGWELRIGERVTVEGLAATLRVADRHRRLLGRMLGILAEDGIVRAVGGEFEVARVPAVSDPQAQCAALVASAPMASNETTLTGRCGEQLADVLRGEADPLPLLFPGGSPAAAEQIYQESPGARTFNGLMQRAIAEAIAQVPADRVLRVLEIGAGTGGTTASILPVLPADRSHYVFTDVSPAFTQRAADRFQAYPFVRYQLLDIEKDPLAQPGIGDQPFDVIIAVNVLHATRKLRETLANLRRLLAPGGVLAIMEAIRPMRWLDLTFGLTDGWWRFADEDLRPAHPLLSSRQWRDLLSASGFEAPVTLPEEPEDTNALSAQALFLARAPRVEVRTAPAVRPAPAVSGDWLILADSDGVGARLADRLRQAGGNCVVALAGHAWSAEGESRWRVNPARPEDFHRLLAEARPSASGAWRGIVHLWSLDVPSAESMTAEELEAGQVLGCGSLLHLVQAAIRGGASPIWAVTRGAQPAGPSAMPPAVMQSTVWGLGRVISLEHPENWGGLVDLGAGDADAAAAALLEEIADPDGEDQVARRGSDRYVARLVRSRGLKTQPAPLRPDAAYLVTGGLGRLGLKVARWMAEQGARHLALMGRKSLPDRALWPTLPSESDAGRAAAAVKEIEALGAKVEIVAGDASDAAQMSVVLERFGQGSPALRGIIHAAAAPGSVSVRDMTLEALSSALRPKVGGGWVLHRLTSAMDLDFFVMFSSTTGLLGARDLGHYAAANTFLDALAHYRRGAGRPAVSIDWGVWDGLRGGTAGAQKTFAGAGLRHMASPRALRALGHLLGSDAPQVVVASVDWATLKPVYEAKRRRPFLEQVGTATKARPKAAAETGSDILQRLAAARPQDRRDLLVEHVRGAVAKVLRLEAGRTIELNRGLFDLGMDSLMSVELKSRLEASLGRPLPSTLTFNYPNVGALVDYLAKDALSLTLSEPVEPTTLPAELASLASDGDDISEDELAMQLAEKLAELR